MDTFYIAAIPPGLAKAFRPVNTAFRKWQPCMLNYFAGVRVTLEAEIDSGPFVPVKS